MDDRKEFSRRIIDRITAGDITSRDGIQRIKVKLSGELGLKDVPKNSDILSFADADERKTAERLLVKKPVRTLSGVAVVAVMTSPHPCPHGKCMYCPGGIESPQSYTGKEPAARRAARNGFDPFLQVTDRIKQLMDTGHRTDKIDLIIMGGTFTSREPEYQEWFVKRCFDAMNPRESKTIEEAHELNETSEHRCVGLTVETRPDVFTEHHIHNAMRLGATRVELGVQILDDAVLGAAERGHGTDAVIKSTKDCKDAGLKVCYHIMPGLPGSDPENDMKSFRKMFGDSSYRPDMLKIYTTLVIEGTKLHDVWAAGEYVPYDTETAVGLLADMKSLIPEYVRVQRIQRDIPAPQIAAGILKSNIRELAHAELEQRGKECRCIRCREIGRSDMKFGDGIVTKITEYEASGGTEHFISAECGDSVAGYIRLRTDDSKTASVREVKVFGQMASIGEEGEWQHRGLGKSLMGIAESIASGKGCSRVRITSGAGVRGYYREMGYFRDGPYMAKNL